MRHLDEEVLEDAAALQKEMGLKINHEFHLILENLEDPIPSDFKVILGKGWFPGFKEQTMAGMRYYWCGQKFDIDWVDGREVKVVKKEITK